MVVAALVIVYLLWDKYFVRSRSSELLTTSHTNALHFCGSRMTL